MIDGRWIENKEPSRAFKYTEFIIHEWLEAENKGENYIKQQQQQQKDGLWQKEGLRPLQWLLRETKTVKSEHLVEDSIKSLFSKASGVLQND